MKKNILITAVFLSFFFFWNLKATPVADPPVKIVLDLPYMAMSSHPGWEERGSEFLRWLSPSVRLRAGTGRVLEYGSGTMIYYDDSKNDMYVLSCGHLFDKGRSRSSKKEIMIDVFYQNEKKLPKFKRYKAEHLCHVWDGSFDVSLCRFKPDWNNPWCLPIAPKNYKLQAGKWYHNLGCDGSTEVAHYLVRYTHEQSASSASGTVLEVFCENNIPRQGRSGGGLFTDDGLLVGVTSRAGSNIGIWSSVQQIHKFIQEEGYGFILESIEFARKIPIVDCNSPQNKYSKYYIPMPQFDNNTYRIVLR